MNFDCFLKPIILVVDIGSIAFLQANWSQANPRERVHPVVPALFGDVVECRIPK